MFSEQLSTGDGLLNTGAPALYCSGCFTLVSVVQRQEIPPLLGGFPKLQLTRVTEIT